MQSSRCTNGGGNIESLDSYCMSCSYDDLCLTSLLDHVTVLHTCGLLSLGQRSTSLLCHASGPNDQSNLLSRAFKSDTIAVAVAAVAAAAVAAAIACVSYTAAIAMRACRQLDSEGLLLVADGTGGMREAGRASPIWSTHSNVSVSP